MAKKNLLSDLVEQLTNALPEHFSAAKKDFEKNCHRIISQAFTKFDIVQREEFDVQTKVLERTRKKCELLDAKLKQLEALIKKKRTS